MSMLPPVPRRRVGAVPTMPQMIRQRAAGGATPGVPLMGRPQQVQPRMPTYTGTPIYNDTRQNRAAPPTGGHPAGGDTRGPLNPNRFTASSGYEGWRHPLNHLNYWAGQGWQYNAAQGRFNYIGDAATGAPVGHPGPGPGPTGPPTGGGPVTGPGGPPTGPPAPNPNPVTGGLPPDPVYEAQQRMLEAALSSTLGGITPQYQTLAANLALQQARLNTNQTHDLRSQNEALASRGAYGGGIQVKDTGDLATNYLRQNQDVANQTAQNYGQLDQAQAAAQAQYQQGLVEALMALAQRQQQSTYST